MTKNELEELQSLSKKNDKVKKMLKFARDCEPFVIYCGDYSYNCYKAENPDFYREVHNGIKDADKAQEQELRAWKKSKESVDESMFSFYSFFLFSEIWHTTCTEYKDAEHDVKFTKIQNSYAKYVDSKFNNSDDSEGEGMYEFLMQEKGKR